MASDQILSHSLVVRQNVRRILLRALPYDSSFRHRNEVLAVLDRDYLGSCGPVDNERGLVGRWKYLAEYPSTERSRSKSQDFVSRYHKRVRKSSHPSPTGSSRVNRMKLFAIDEHDCEQADYYYCCCCCCCCRRHPYISQGSGREKGQGNEIASACPAL